MRHPQRNDSHESAGAGHAGSQPNAFQGPQDGRMTVDGTPTPFLKGWLLEPLKFAQKADGMLAVVAADLTEFIKDFGLLFFGFGLLVS